MAQPKNFGFGSDEQMVRDQASRFLKDRVPVDKLRTLVARDEKAAYESDVHPAAWDEKLWRDAVELGWTGLGIAEEQGGVGLPLVALAAVCEEAGRSSRRCARPKSSRRATAKLLGLRSRPSPEEAPPRLRRSAKPCRGRRPTPTSSPMLRVADSR